MNLAERRDNDLLVRYIHHLPDAFRQTRRDHPFEINAIVILREHFHCIWQLPPGDDDYSTRWRLITTRFSLALPKSERISTSRLRKSERGIWQRRFWEHAIRDERDYWNQVDYIHYNPVKHGYAQTAKDWPHSSFHRYVERGIYTNDGRFAGNYRISMGVKDYCGDRLAGFPLRSNSAYALRTAFSLYRTVGWVRRTTGMACKLKKIIRAP